MLTRRRSKLACKVEKGHGQRERNRVHQDRLKEVNLATLLCLLIQSAIYPVNAIHPQPSRVLLPCFLTHQQCVHGRILADSVGIFSSSFLGEPLCRSSDVSLESEETLTADEQQLEVGVSITFGVPSESMNVCVGGFVLAYM